MKLKTIISCLAAVLLPASATFAANVSDWTFETSEPGVVDGPAAPGAGVYITNIVAEGGSAPGTASGRHAGASTYSSPAGNGSSHSFSSTLWAVGDFYQFAVNTTGGHNIIVSYDQISSTTGPGQFNFQYSTDGVNFTQFGSTYTVIANTGSTIWSSGTPITVSSYTNNLSSITALNNAPVVYFRLVDAGTTAANGGTVATGGTDRVDNFLVTDSTGAPPTIGSLAPSSRTIAAGNPATFTVIMSAGDTPMSFFWYKITGSATLTTNLYFSQTNSFYTNYLDFASVVESNAASYQLVVTNATGVNATSAVVTLAVNDPAINVQPVSQTGLLGASVQFYVLAGGTGLTYQWYYSDGSGNIIEPVPAGTQASGSTASGVHGPTLQISDLHNGDNGSNFVVVVTGTSPVNDGPLTSSVASLSVVTSGSLAIWDFNGNYLNITNPVPYQGVGTASSMNVTPFLQPNQDPYDSTPTFGANNAWGTEDYPATGLNKEAGVQFNTSTLNVKNINVSFDLRGTSTASLYQRLQFTTNGLTWVDYPASQNLLNDASVWQQGISYNLAGIPGVANNTNFGIRLVSEFESTARYGDTNDAIYVGISSTYATGGTLSYDYVNITGDAITDTNQPPVISSIPAQQMYDTQGITVHFTVSDVSAPVGSISFTAACLDPSLNVTVGTPANTGGSVSLSINSSIGSPYTFYAPILITATDANGNVAQAWFTLEIDSISAPPSIVGLVSSNLFPNCLLYPNSTLVESYTVSDPQSAPSAITMAAFSGNVTLLSNASASLSLGGVGTANQTLHITPNTNQEGAVPVTVSATDARSLTSTVTNYFEVRPNTNVLLVDYFNYDNNGSTSIVTNSGGLWQNHSGTVGQLNAGSGVATIDGVNHTEDVNATLIGGPYAINGPTVLYSSYIINYTQLPDATGSYCTHYKDSSTSNFLCKVWSTITGAAPGDYRLGIAEVTNDPVYFPQDLVPGSNYTVVTRFNLSSLNSTLWINPLSESSAGVTNTSFDSTQATSVSAYAMRESTADEGILNVSKLKIGLTFDSVFPSPQIQSTLPTVVVSWSDPTLGIQSATNVLGPWTDVTGAKSPYTNNTVTNDLFFRFGR